MARVIDKGFAKPTDPIYTEGIRISSVQRPHQGESTSSPKAGLKKCPKCKKTLPRKKFSVSRQHPDGLFHHCKQCQNIYYKARHKSKKDDYRFQCHEIVRKKRAQCRKRELLFDLDTEWMVAAMAKTNCDATGIPFEEGKDGPFSRSLDRISPYKGYTKENTRVVIKIYNFAKHDWDEATVLRMARALVDKNPQ